MRILLALDGSAESTEALGFLARLPFAIKPKVSLFSVVMPAIVSEVSVPMQEIEEANAKDILRRAHAVLEPMGYVTEQIIEFGNPSHSILDKGKELDVDLIMLGARGHSAAFRVVLGSTADSVANHAKCPVLVVRPNANPSPPNPEFKVVLAYDDSPPAKTAFKQLSDFDWPADKTSVTICTFFEKPRLLSEDDVYDPESISDANRTLAAISASARWKCKTTHIVRETKHIGDAIRGVVEAEDSNLLFVGDTGKSAITRFFLGSISRYLLHHATTSIWIARNKDWN